MNQETKTFYTYCKSAEGWWNWMWSGIIAESGLSRFLSLSTISGFIYLKRLINKA